MNQLQFKNILRSAVIAALPLATQVGCNSSANTVVKPDRNYSAVSNEGSSPANAILIASVADRPCFRQVET